MGPTAQVRPRKSGGCFIPSPLHLRLWKPAWAAFEFSASAMVSGSWGIAVQYRSNPLSHNSITDHWYIENVLCSTF